MQRQAASKAAFDAAIAKRDYDKAKVLQAQADTKQAQINLDYTRVVAPFDGIVTARQVSIGELVGGSGTQVLATIVQLDPIYVNFNASERDVLHVRDMLYKRGQRAADLLGTEVEVGLQTDQGYPHKGKLDYIAPTVNQGTGTLAARAELPNALRLMLPGFFVRVRVPLRGNAGAAGAVGRARQRSGRALCAGRQRREHRGAAQGRGRPGGRRDGRDRERAQAGRPRHHRRPAARDPGTEGRSADSRRGREVAAP